MRIKDLIKQLDEARGELGDCVIPDRLAELVETMIDEQRMIFDMSDPSGAKAFSPMGRNEFLSAGTEVLESFAVIYFSIPRYDSGGFTWCRHERPKRHTNQSRAFGAEN